MDKRVLLLSVYRAVLGITIAVHLLAAALVSHGILDNKSLATVPVFAHSLATALVSVPASWFMSRFGRSAGFATGAACGVIGTAVVAWGISSASFATICVGSVLIGMYNGCGHFYRFAAVEVTTESFRSRAISLVVAGGVAAGIVGPSLAEWTKDALDTSFSGSYLALSVLIGITATTLLFLEIPRPAPLRFFGGRPVFHMLRYPPFLVALLAGALGYGIMALLMVSAPLAMDARHLHFSYAVMAMQGHFVAMFAPSFVTGSIIARVGVLRVMTWGVGLKVAAVAVACAGGEVIHFIVSLFLVGVGWNFLFVGANVLLTTSYLPEEKAKAQALFNLLTYSLVCLAAFSGGAVHESFGWTTVNLFALPAAVVIAVVVVWSRVRRVQSLSEFLGDSPSPDQNGESFK